MTDNALKIIKDELARIETDYKHCCLGASIPGYGHSRNCYDTGPTNKKMREMAKALSVAVENLHAFANPEPFYKQSDMIYEADFALNTIANILSGGKDGK